MPSMKSTLENKLNKVFVEDAPYQLPKNVKEWIVRYLPYINLFFGLLSLYSAYILFSWARTADNYINQITDDLTYSKLTPLVLVLILFTVAQAVIYLVSFSYLKNNQKFGWDLMIYATLLYSIYGFLGLFSDYGGVFNLIMYVLSTVIGFYILFQIRAYYIKKPKK
jgi:uncharacterized membrane protein HdeD (DUF308 family)